MINFDEFTRIVEEETAVLPDYVHEGLNGGVLTDPGAYLHPGRVADDLYILGTYTADSFFGNQIVLFYGSFTASLADSDVQVYRQKIRDTLRHEFLHHLETRAGLFRKGSLVEEDKERMRQYYLEHKK